MTWRRRAALAVALLAVNASACQRSNNAAVRLSRASSSELPENPAALATMLGVPPESLLVAAEERYNRQAYDTARAILKVEVDRALAAHDRHAEASARMWLGLAAWRNGDYATARKEGEAALSIKRMAGLDSEMSRSFNALGLVSWNEGKHRESLAFFDSAVAAARRNHDPRGLARAAANIPLVLVELGQYDAAARGFAAARRAGRAINDDRVQANALANLAMLRIRLGRPAESLKLLDEARTYYHKDDYTTGEANALGQIATALGAMGNFRGAIAAADSALVIARAAGLAQEIAATNEVIADIYSETGNLRLALRRMQEADSIDASVGLSMERGINSRRMSSILVSLGEDQAAEVRARAALALHRAADDVSETIYDRLALSRALMASDRASATAQIDTAMREADTTHNESARRSAAIAAAEVWLARLQPRQAERELALFPPNALDGWEMEDARSDVAAALHQMSDAQLYAEKAVRSIERERASLGSGLLHNGYLEGKLRPYSRLVQIYVASGDTAAAFRVAASAIRGNTAGQQGTPPRANADKSKAERMLWETAAIQQELAAASSAEQRDSLQRRLGRLKDDYEEAAARIGLTSLSEAKTETTDDLTIRSALRPTDAVLTYLCGPDRLDIFVVRRERIFYKAVRIGCRELGVRVRLARELFGTGGPAALPTNVLAELYNLLVGPLQESAALHDATRLMIVPGGPLGAIPFAALFSAGSGRYLVETYTLVTLPTVTAAVVAPDVARKWGTLVSVFAPESNSLRGTLREARSIGQIFPHSRVHLGTQSTEYQVRTSLFGDGIVHIASHGSHDAHDPLFSEIDVGPARSANPFDDGRLDVHEILGIRTSVPLVFLSGCETGLISEGSDASLRGIDGGSLAQAFLAAGAQTVVSTLWPVADDGAADMASRYYAFLKSGLDPDEALASTQRLMIRSGHGVSWAAYTVGSGRARKIGRPFRATLVGSPHSSTPEP